jgi:hypothetical protein
MAQFTKDVDPQEFDTDADGWTAHISVDGVNTIYFHLPHGVVLTVPLPAPILASLRAELAAAMTSDPQFKAK